MFSFSGGESSIKINFFVIVSDIILALRVYIPKMTICVNIFVLVIFTFFFGSTGVQTQSLVLARLAFEPCPRHLLL
jgi:hypothetical protein